MNIYLAPLEGITGWIYRGAVQKCFGGFDKYFITFIKPNQMGRFSAREKKDILPEHNKGIHAVPQILTNCAEDFVQTAKKLEQYGYKEINLNVGCPSKTVVTKGRGAGFLAFPERLDLFLEEVFQNCPIDISVKTRIGTESGEEFPKLMDIYNKYPIKELIIHPRTQKDFYKKTRCQKGFASRVSGFYFSIFTAFRYQAISCFFCDATALPPEFQPLPIRAGVPFCVA